MREGGEERYWNGSPSGSAIENPVSTKGKESPREVSALTQPRSKCQSWDFHLILDLPTGGAPSYRVHPTIGALALTLPALLGARVCLGLSVPTTLL